jgi:thioredoxin reductase
MCKIYEAAGLDCLHLRIGPEWMHIAEFAPDVWFTGFGIDGTTSFGHQFDFSRHWQGMLDGSHSGAGLMINVAEAYKKGGIKIPVGTVTYMDPARGPDFFEKALQDGKVDYYIMNRPLTVDPEYVNKLRDGRIDEIAPCTRCLHCHQDFDMEGNLFECCRINATTYRANLKDDYYHGCMPEGYEPLPARGNKNVMVVGAGPAGMEAARVAAQRGYRVTLYEKNSYLGGLIPIANAIKGPHENLEDWRAWLVRQLELKGVTVVTGQEVDAAFIAQQKPDVVILAAGGKRGKLNLSGTGGTNIVSINDVVRPNIIGSKVTVVGSNCQAADVVLYLQAQGKHVTVVTADPVNIVTPEQQIMADQTMLGKGHAFHVRVYTWPMIYARGTRVYPQSEIASVGNGEITIRADSGAIVNVKCDTIVEAMDMLPNKDLLNSISVADKYAVGDCDKPWNFADAVAAGNLTARKI